MSKRYPPIFNVILFLVAVCIILANPMTILMPWISTVTSFVVFAVSGIDAVGDIAVLTFIQPMTITLIFGATMMIGLVLAYFKADSILTSKLRSEAGEK